MANILSVLLLLWHVGVWLALFALCGPIQYSLAVSCVSSTRDIAAVPYPALLCVKS